MFGRPTIGEVYRRIDALDQATQNSFQAIDERLSTSLVARGEYLARYEALSARVDNLEAANVAVTGYRRALVLGVVVALVTSVGSWIALAVHIS